MKNLEMTQMEAVYGGGPNRNQVLCYLFSVAYGLINPVLGIITGAVCLWSYEISVSNGEG